MTSAQVSGTSTGVMEFVSMIQTNQIATDSTSDFSKLMESKSDPIDQMDVTSSEGSHATEPDSAEETNFRTKEYEKFENPVDERETIESIEDTVEDVKAEIAEELDITVEDLEQAMENLGLSNFDLLDVSNLPSLLSEITGQEAILILTDAELSGTLNELIQIVGENNTELAKELNALPEELLQIVNAMEDFVSKDEGIAENLIESGEEVTTVEKTVSPEQATRGEVTMKEGEQTSEAKVLVGNEKEVQITVNADQSSNSSFGEQARGSLAEEAGVNQAKTDETNVNANVVQEFAEQIITNLEDAVAEITYTSETMDAEGIMKQIVSQLKVSVGSDVTSMELQLQPENLGKLDLQIAMEDGKLVAEFKAENESVKNVIEGQLIQLKETLEEQGIKVSSVEVSVEQQGLHQNMDQNQNNQGETNEAQKQNVRKINLQGIRSIEDIEFEDLNEDELMTAKLMLENGNTVDFTA